MKNNPLTIIRTIADICLLKGSPANLPYSIILLTSLIFFKIIFSALNLSHIKDSTPLQAMSAASFSEAVFIGLLYLLFKHTQHLARFHKALLAIYATLIGLRILCEFGVILLPTFMPILILIYFCWILTVYGYVLKQAINMKLPFAILTMLGILIASFIPIAAIFSEQFQQASQQLQVQPLKAEGT